MVHPSAPVKTFQEFMTWTKTSKVPLNFGSAGIGSGGHLAGELYSLMAGIKAQHIPYKGTGPAMSDLIAGQYQYNFAGLLGAIPLHRSGKLRGLAVTSMKRLAGISEIPTINESGLPGFEVVGWYGLYAPPKMAKPMLMRIHKEIVEILAEADTIKRIHNVGSIAVGNDPEVFRKFLIADMEKWKDVVKRSGAKLE
jgi:tripartite-type tricarboxylate transporter receptor subunit TctC